MELEPGPSPETLDSQPHGDTAIIPFSTVEDALNDAVQHGKMTRQEADECLDEYRDVFDTYQPPQ